jgi:hypothetical protein
MRPASGAFSCAGRVGGSCAIAPVRCSVDARLRVLGFTPGNLLGQLAHRTNVRAGQHSAVLQQTWNARTGISEGSPGSVWLPAGAEDRTRRDRRKDLPALGLGERAAVAMDTAIATRKLLARSKRSNIHDLRSHSSDGEVGGSYVGVYGGAHFGWYKPLGRWRLSRWVRLRCARLLPATATVIASVRVSGVDPVLWSPCRCGTRSPRCRRADRRMTSSFVAA